VEIRRAATSIDLTRLRQFYKAAQYGGTVSDDSVAFFAEEGDALIGVARIELECGTLVLRGMRVSIERRREQVGTALLKEIARYLGEQPCYCIPYTHLIEFYAQVGFIEIVAPEAPPHLRERLSEYRAAGLDVTMMRKSEDR
jgi:N-acetylglutamate synthase-like GNAT family acetyltransferase